MIVGIVALPLAIAFAIASGVTPDRGLWTAILVVVAYNMSEWRVFVAEFRGPRSDLAVLITTFLLTVLVDLTVAIGVGMVMASFLFMRRMSELSSVTAISREASDEPDTNGTPDPRVAALPNDVPVIDSTGPDAITDSLDDALMQVRLTAPDSSRVPPTL